MKNNSKKSTEKENWIVGKCNYCEKMIMGNEPYEVLYCRRATPIEVGRNTVDKREYPEYSKGLLHRKCMAKGLKFFTIELLNDMETYRWLADKKLDNDRQATLKKIELAKKELAQERVELKKLRTNILNILKEEEGEVGHKREKGRTKKVS